jgi:hypothetical protein
VRAAGGSHAVVESEHSIAIIPSHRLTHLNGAWRTLADGVSLARAGRFVASYAESVEDGKDRTFALSTARAAMQQ